MQEGAFAGLGDAVEQKKALFACGACEAIAQRPLQEHDQFRIALHRLLEKLHPQGAPAASRKFESERLCTDKRVNASCDVGLLDFCSMLLWRPLACAPSSCT